MSTSTHASRAAKFSAMRSVDSQWVSMEAEWVSNEGEGMTPKTFPHR